MPPERVELQFTTIRGEHKSFWDILPPIVVTALYFRRLTYPDTLMQTTEGRLPLQYLRQHRLIRNTLIGSVKWLQGKLPDHAIEQDITCKDGKYELRVSVELLDAVLMQHFDKQRETAKHLGNIPLKAAQ